MFASTPSMSSSTSAFGSPLLFGQTSNSMDAFGGILSPFTWGSSTGSTPFFQTTATNASRSSGTGFDFTTASAHQTSMPWGSTLSETMTYPLGIQNPFSGSQVKAPVFGSESEKFSFGVKQGSRVTSYSKTTEIDDKGQGNMIVSISAMPAYKDKSHEELMWEDHHQFNAEEFNAEAGGVVPAFARNHSTCPSLIFPSVPSNPFATKVTPPSITQNSFPNPVPLSVPGVWGPVNPSVPGVGGPVPPSVASSPFATTVTPPSIGQYSFLNHVKANLESVVDKMEEWQKSTQLIHKDVKHIQEDMKSWIEREIHIWIERERSLELEKIETTQTIRQMREELAHVTRRSKDAIIAEYLASPAFTKRLDEEHEKRLSKIFHPGYVKALGAVQTNSPGINIFSSHRPATSWFPPAGHNPCFGST